MCFSLRIGFVVRWKIFDPPTREQMYDDEDFWEVGLFFSLVVVLERSKKSDTSHYRAMRTFYYAVHEASRAFTRSRAETMNSSGAPCVD